MFKLAKSVYREAIRAIFTGIYVSIGCVAFISAGLNAYGAFLASMIILVITVFDLPLFTERITIVVYGEPDRILVNLGRVTLMAFGNFAGCYFSSLAIRGTRYAELIARGCKALCEERVVDTPSGLFLLGFCCNLLIFTTTRIYREQGPVVGCLTTVTATMIYITCNFEHSIVNSFLMIMSGYGFQPRAAVLIPIALGNAVGAVGPALLPDPPKQKSPGDDIYG